MPKTIDVEKLSIVHYPHPVLRKVCQPVEQFDDQLRRLAARMLELMHLGRGIGLAAPQVGLTWRLFVCSHTGEPGDDLVLVNQRRDPGMRPGGQPLRAPGHRSGRPRLAT